MSLPFQGVSSASGQSAKSYAGVKRKGKLMASFGDVGSSVGTTPIWADIPTTLVSSQVFLLQSEKFSSPCTNEIRSCEKKDPMIYILDILLEYFLVDSTTVDTLTLPINAQPPHLVLQRPNTRGVLRMHAPQHR